MGLATINPYSHKVQTKLYKTPKFCVNRPKSKQDTAIWKCQSLQRNVWPSGRRVGQRPDAIHFFVSQSKLAWLTPNLGILWIPVCSFWLCGSIVANPIIYRLVPSPSRFEIRQFTFFWCYYYLHSCWLREWKRAMIITWLTRWQLVLNFSYLILGNL